MRRSSKVERQPSAQSESVSNVSEWVVHRLRFSHWTGSGVRTGSGSGFPRSRWTASSQSHFRVRSVVQLRLWANNSRSTGACRIRCPWKSVIWFQIGTRLQYKLDYQNLPVKSFICALLRLEATYLFPPYNILYDITPLAHRESTNCAAIEICWFRVFAEIVREIHFSLIK